MPKTHHHSYQSASYQHNSNPLVPLLYKALLIIIGGFAIAWVFTTYSPFGQQERANSVVGSPTISASFINRVLVYYHSPAAGKGQTLYDDGVKYGIDPAYALAFFMEESTFGTQGVARVTHSLGNIRAVSGYPQVDGYRYYRTWEEGFEDWYRLISHQYVGQWGLSTVEQIIPVYAPGSDNNDEAAYIQTVKSAVYTWRSGQIDV